MTSSSSSAERIQMRRAACGNGAEVGRQGRKKNDECRSRLSRGICRSRSSRGPHLGIQGLNVVSDGAEFLDHSRSTCLLGPLAHGWPLFDVTYTLVQKLPNQPPQTVRKCPHGGVPS